MKKLKCLAFTRDIKVYQEELGKRNFPGLEIIITEDEKVILENIEDTDIIFGNPPITKKYIKKAKNIKWVQSSFAGIDALVSEDLPDNYILTNVKNTYGKPMAEYVFAYILGIKREVLENKICQKEKKWNQHGHGSVSGKTIAIAGTGSIGKEIARVAKAFGMNTKGLNTKGKSVEHFDSVFSCDRLEDFLEGSDYVVSVLPNTRETYNFFDKKAFTSMPKDSWFISIGRGANVLEEDLIEAIQEGSIAGAVLDVFKNEPLPEDSPLWTQPSVYITPHISGYVETDEMYNIFEENYKRFTEGKDLMYQIDFNKGY